MSSRLWLGVAENSKECTCPTPGHLLLGQADPFVCYIGDLLMCQPS